MEIAEYNDMVRDMIADARAIIHNQRVLAQLHEATAVNLEDPFEQDWIYQEHFGSFPSDPQTTLVDGVSITTRVLHQTGARLSDISGGDLLYEIEGEKFAVIQYKRASKGRVIFDEDQVRAMLAICPVVCFYRRKPPRRSPIRLNGFCGCYHRVQDGGTGRLVHTCEVPVIHQHSQSVEVGAYQHGVLSDSFLQMFASCRVGAPVSAIDSNQYVEGVLEQDRFVLQFRQEGRWGDAR